MAGRGYSKKYISTATTTNVPGNATDASCVLHTITINGGTAGTITVYDDSNSGTLAARRIAIIEAIGATNPVSLIYDAIMNNGITIVTAAATDVTVTWQ